MRLIVNADDFGLDTTTNAGVLIAFNQGLISSSTIMANMPGFEEACEIARERKLLQHIGIHAVFTAGLPITERIRREPSFCDSDGRFRSRQMHFCLSNSEFDACAEEIEAQIKLCRGNGLPLTHIDSHHYIHEWWGIATVFMHVARYHGIKGIRITPKGIKDIHRYKYRRLKNAYRHIVDWRLRRGGFAKTDLLLMPGEYTARLRSRGSSQLNEHTAVEVIVHPGFSDDGELIDALERQALTKCLAGIPVSEAVSYTGAILGPEQA